MLRISNYVRKRPGFAAGLLVSGVVAGLLVAGMGSAQDAGRSAFAPPPTFADVFEQVNPAVVTVAVNQEPIVPTASGQSPWAGTPFEDFPFESFGLPDLRQMVPMIPGPAPRQGIGSGFIIDPEGYIATNYHVVDGARNLTVQMANGEEYVATVVGTDPNTDLALIKIDGPRGLPALRFGNSDQARVGDWVLAIGNPFGIGGSATAGIISARGRNIYSGPYDDYLQIDAPINSGNSGGPIFNAVGEVIGINTAIFSPSGGNVGIGFAIPANQASEVLDELRTDGSVSRGWLGVEMAMEDSADVGGVLIDRIVTDGPAEIAGLHAGDRILRFDGQTIETPRDLSRLVGSLDAGDEVEIEVVRNGERREFTARLGQREEDRIQASIREVEPLPQAQPYQRYRGTQPYFRR